MNFPENAASGFPVGTTVRHFHKERELDRDDIRAHFRKLTKEEVAALSPNTAVWVDLSPYAVDNSIGAFTKCLVTKVEPIPGGVCLHFENQQIVQKNNIQPDIRIASSELELMELALHIPYCVVHVRPR